MRRRSVELDGEYAAFEPQHVVVVEGHPERGPRRVEREQEGPAAEVLRTIDVERARDPDRGARERDREGAGRRRPAHEILVVRDDAGAQVDGRIEGEQVAAGREGDGVDDGVRRHAFCARVEDDRVGLTVPAHDVPAAGDEAAEIDGGIEREQKCAAQLLSVGDDVGLARQAAEAFEEHDAELVVDADVVVGGDHACAEVDRDVGGSGNDGLGRRRGRHHQGGRDRDPTGQSDRSPHRLRLLEVAPPRGPKNLRGARRTGPFWPRSAPRSLN
ncbi:MAG: hypothetical protein R3E53_22380 [Myxococcota bacterium]